MKTQVLEFDGTKLLTFMPKGMSFAELGRRTGVTRQAIHDIVKGRRNPSANLAVKITAELNISLSDLSNKKFTELVS